MDTVDTECSECQPSEWAVENIPQIFDASFPVCPLCFTSNLLNYAQPTGASCESGDQYCPQCQPWVEALEGEEAEAYRRSREVAVQGYMWDASIGAMRRTLGMRPGSVGSKQPPPEHGEQQQC